MINVRIPDMKRVMFFLSEKNVILKKRDFSEFQNVRNRDRFSSGFVIL